MLLATLIAIPLLIIWLLTLVDIIRRADLGAGSKVLWALLALVLPVLGPHHLLRPASFAAEGPSAAGGRGRQRGPARAVPPRPGLGGGRRRARARAQSLEENSLMPWNTLDVLYGHSGSRSQRSRRRPPREGSPAHGNRT